ncbi:hypothetical protein ACFQWC_06730 [Rossellomorea sp. GCM10028870]|uniref:hypothetical protein n=1 Tax=Rossellomorea sp. GCM10028870 TaxID=3273426 RepID=UPI00360CD466
MSKAVGKCLKHGFLYDLIEFTLMEHRKIIPPSVYLRSSDLKNREYSGTSIISWESTTIFTVTGC